MKLLIDTADIDRIKTLYTYYDFDGVTTNPNLLAKVEKEPRATLKEIRAFLPDKAQLHIQAVSKDTAGIIAEAHSINEVFGINIYIKVAVTKEGLAAMRVLCSEGLHITATAVFHPMQALLAAKCGADYVAPYIHRTNNMGYDGLKVIENIHHILEANQLQTKVLAAAFENTEQISCVAQYSGVCATIFPDILDEILHNQMSISAVNNFYTNFNETFGLERI